MAVVTTLTASLLPIPSPSPTPAPSVVDSSPNTEQTGQNAPSVGIEGSYQNKRQP